MKDFGLYIHVPFCRSKCAYCDFYSLSGHEGCDLAAYPEALRREMDSRQDFNGFSTLSSIYFGGGTPSLLQPEQFGFIFDRISERWNPAEDCEITFEANPDDLSDNYLSLLRHPDKALPFNRVSIGCQSFDDGELRRVGRRHTAEQAFRAVERCRAHGLGNISIDLMYGLPGQTLESFSRSLDKALELNVPHISAYMLSLAPEVPLERARLRGEWQEADDETARAMFHLLVEKLLAAGYEHYEISNFARPGFRSRHNSSYWQGKAYLGLGPGAHSYNGGADGRHIRRWNARHLKEYLAGNFVYEEEELCLSDRYNDFIMTRARTCEGIDLDVLQAEFGEEMLEYCLHEARPYLQNGQLVQYLDGQGKRHLKISSGALFVSDGITADLFYV